MKWKAIMLDNTKRVWNKTKYDIELIKNAFEFGTQVLCILYLLYAVFTSPIWYINLSLLIVSIAFLVFDIVITNYIDREKRSMGFWTKRKHKKNIKKLKKRKANIKKVKNLISYALKLFVLANAIYPIIVTPDDVHPLSILLTAFLVLIWVIKILIDIIIGLIENRFDMFMEAIEADFEFVTKPFTKVHDVATETIHTVLDAATATKKRVGGFLNKIINGNADSDNNITHSTSEEEETV